MYDIALNRLAMPDDLRYAEHFVIEPATCLKDLEYLLPNFSRADDWFNSSFCGWPVDGNMAAAQVIIIFCCLTFEFTVNTVITLSNI